MRCYAKYNENNDLILIGTGLGGVEITEEEYNRLLAEIRTKTDLVNKLYNSEIALEDVPSEWQEEIQRRVNERIEMEKLLETEETDNATEADYIEALERLGVSE